MRAVGLKRGERYTASAGTLTIDLADESLVSAEEIVRREAAKLEITVDEKEIDGGIEMIAKGVGLTPAELMKEVLRQSLTARAYREEIARQILEGKWVQRKVRSSVHRKAGTTDAEMLETLEKARKKAIADLRARSYVEVML